MTKKIPAWLKFIAKEGNRAVRERLGVHYETVRGWEELSILPADKHKAKLVKWAGGLFDFNSFFE